MLAVRRAGVTLLLVVAAMCGAATPASAADTLRAGAGRADITPDTGHYLGGWTRADRTAKGAQTRLYARTIVLQKGNQKVALVSVDLFMIPGGLVKQIGDSLAARGFSEQNILVSASHTHSGPGGYANFPTLNSAAPSPQTANDPTTFTNFFFQPQPADPQLYRFLHDQISASIVRADDDLAPAQVGWGHQELLGITRNRSIEAHLANFGIIEERGTGNESQAPGGYPETIDPSVDVLRVDKLVRRGRKRVKVPIGAWSTFADHGTVTKSSFQYYNADHHGSATRVFESAVRKKGRVAPAQQVVNVYGNSDEGDMSAGLDRSGPAASDFVGREEAAAMLRAWNEAGRNASTAPVFDMRWTRMCFCGQQVEGGGRVADQSQVGIPFLTGSEEERGPLFDITGEEFEGRTNPVDTGGPQGDKLSAPGVGTGGVPNRLPLLAIRIGDRLVVSIPGEPTKEVGTRTRAAVAASTQGAGINRVVVSGLANEFALYFTTPEEYQRQHYEGGNTHFGQYSSVLVEQELATLARRLVRGEPAQAPADFDPTNGVKPDGAPYGPGAAEGKFIGGPPAKPYGRLDRATIAWQGGPKGLDRPVDGAFITAERKVGKRWVAYESDLGLSFLWRVDDNGRYDAQWEIPLSTPMGTYRLVVTAKRYRVESQPFQIEGAQTPNLVELPAPAGRVAVALEYPDAIRDVDTTSRPKRATGGTVVFRVGNRNVKVKRNGSTWSVAAPAGTPVSVARKGARDRWGNFDGNALKLR